MKNKIAVIGNGFVGGSLTTVFYEKGFDVFVYDKAGKAATGAKTFIRLDKNSSESVRWEEPFESVTDLVRKCEHVLDKEFAGVYFVCLPTPMLENGSADVSIVEGVLSELASVSGKRIAIVKSTVPPGSTERWNKQFEGTGLRVIFSPEFLREATALDDMRNQDRIVLGGPRPYINQAKQVLESAFPNVPIIKTSSTTAEMVKYVTNCFLATKVSFANEMAQICEALDAKGANLDFDKVVEYAKLDDRLGKSHWGVPGPDGKRAFGGHCLPKDLNSLMFLARELGIDPKVMTATWQKCLELRPERDWERLVGRAVTKKPTEK